MSNNIGKTLLELARASIYDELGQDHEFITEAINNTRQEDTSWLQQKAACFITITRQGKLRGCIGTIDPHRSLLDDVKNNAKAAAFHDPRFSPLGVDELDTIEIEISLLSATQAMDFSDEEDALKQLQPGIDGLVFEYERHRSTFLPQVWKTLPMAKDFIAHLKQKAGLSTDFWSEDVRLSRYTVSKWKESDFEANYD